MTVIIPTFRRWQSLLITLRSFLELADPPDEIVVVDQTPRRELRREELAQFDELRTTHAQTPVKYIRQREPHVYRARNRGGEAATSDIILFTDDDIRPVEGSVAAHVEAYSEPELSAAVGPVRDPGRRLPWRTQVPDFRETAGPTQVYAHCTFDWLNRVSWIAGIYAGNFSIRREAFYEVGGWEELIRTRGDKELGLRLHAMGKRIDYLPQALMMHHEPSYGGSDFNDDRMPWNAYERSVGFLYIGTRYLDPSDFKNPWGFWRAGIFPASRTTFLLKRHFRRPWRWPSELWGFLVAFLDAQRHARRTRRGPVKYV